MTSNNMTSSDRQPFLFECVCLGDGTPDKRPCPLGTFLSVEQALEIAKTCESVRASVRPLRRAVPRLKDVLATLQDAPELWSDCCPDDEPIIDDSDATLATRLDAEINAAIARVLEDVSISACDYAGEARIFELRLTGWHEVTP